MSPMLAGYRAGRYPNAYNKSGSGLFVPALSMGGGGGGGTSGGTTGTPATAPTGVSGNWNVIFEDLFPGTSLSNNWYPNRGGGTLPTDQTTNNPPMQLDTSDSRNVIVNNGLFMYYSTPYSNSADPSKPYAGAHVTSLAGYAQPGRIVEIVAKFEKNGSGWPAAAYYGLTGGPGGEIDNPEFLNCTSNPNGWFNIHDGGYTIQSLNSPTSDSTGNFGKAYAGDNLYHIWTLDWSAGGTTITSRIDGVFQQTGNIYAQTNFIISFDLGVQTGSGVTFAPGQTQALGISCNRVTVFGPA